MHDCIPAYLCHAVLFQFIFAGEKYERLSLLIAPYHSQANCIQSTANKIVELNNYMSLALFTVLFNPVFMTRSERQAPTYESVFARTS